jgi:hypothetical protein
MPVILTPLGGEERGGGVIDIVLNIKGKTPWGLPAAAGG